jgi:hypothetical protein
MEFDFQLENLEEWPINTHMMSRLAIQALADELAKKLKITPAKALRYAHAIGDTPEWDEDGLLVVREDEEVIDRIPIQRPF